MFHSFFCVCKCTTLSKLYYNLGKKRNIPVKEFCNCERLANKCAKLQLDITYFDNCDSLGFFHKFLHVNFSRHSCIKMQHQNYNVQFYVNKYHQ